MSSSLLVGLVLWFGCGVLAAGMNHAYMLAEFGPDKHARKWAAFAILIGAAGLVFSLVMSRGHGWRWPWGDNGHTGISTTDTEGDTASGATYYASTAITTTAYANTGGAVAGALTRPIPRLSDEPTIGYKVLEWHKGRYRSAMGLQSFWDGSPPTLTARCSQPPTYRFTATVTATPRSSTAGWANSLFSGGYPWDVRGMEHETEPEPVPHVAPEQGCTCGIYSLDDPNNVVQEFRGRLVAIRYWGKTIDGARGHRSQFAQVIAEFDMATWAWRRVVEPSYLAMMAGVDTRA